MSENAVAAKPAAGENSLALAALLVGALAMGLSPTFVRWADVGPFASAFWRVTLALPALYLWMRISERGLARRAARFSLPTLLAGAAFAADLMFWHVSILTTSVADATFFAVTAPIWVIGFGWWLYREKASARTLVGLGFCFAGGVALIARDLQFRPEGAIGDLEGLGTGLFFGLYFLAVQAARKTASAARVTFESTLVTAAALFVVSTVFERTLLPQNLAGAGALLGMAWVSHACGQGLLTVALGRLPAVFSSLVIFLEAVAAAAFALVFLGEPVSAAQAFGGLLIVAGIYVARPAI